jgi:hypothetical protein
MEEILEGGYCQYLAPPVKKFSTLQFSSYDEIQEIGYTYGKVKFYNTAIMLKELTVQHGLRRLLFLPGANKILYRAYSLQIQTTKVIMKNQLIMQNRKSLP